MDRRQSEDVKKKEEELGLPAASECGLHNGPWGETLPLSCKSTIWLTFLVLIAIDKPKMIREKNILYLPNAHAVLFAPFFPPLLEDTKTKEEIPFMCSPCTTH